MSLDRARLLLLHDRLDEAEAILSELSGQTGAEGRRAKVERGRLAVRRGEVGFALEWFRDAWGTPVHDDEDALAKYEAARYLGELLERLGEYLQAEAVLRSAAEERLESASQEDPEWAALATSLAAVLLALNRRGEAKLLAEVAARSLWEAGDERAVEGLIVRAMAIKATQGRHAEALEPLYALPEETQDALLREVVVGQRHRARLLIPVLSEVNAWHKKQRGMPHPQVLALIAELSQQLELRRERIYALEELAGYFLRSGDDDLHAHALIALARAHAEARHPEKGVALLVEAAEVRPNPARYWREAGAMAQDPVLLDKAIETGDEVEAARAHAALGVLWAHRGEPELALPHLEAGARLASPDPDAQLARLHLVALRDGGTCGCGEASGAMSRALQDALFEVLPADLVYVAGVIGTPSGLELRLELGREPSPAERAHIDGSIDRVRKRFEQRD